MTFTLRALVYVTLALLVSCQRLPLPPNLISFESAEGRQLLIDCLQDGQVSFTKLMAHWEKQILATFCGVATSVCVLNALGLPGPTMETFPAQFGYFTQSNLLVMPQVRQVINESIVHKEGMTLDQLAVTLEAAGDGNVTAEVHHADHSDLSELREHIVQSVYNEDVFVVINYLRFGALQRNVGHFSPIAAYHPATDRALLLDVTKHKYPAVWVTLTDLFYAMDTAEGTEKRGFVKVQLRADE